MLACMETDKKKNEVNMTCRYAALNGLNFESNYWNENRSNILQIKEDKTKRFSLTPESSILHVIQIGCHAFELYGVHLGHNLQTSKVPHTLNLTNSTPCLLNWLTLT